ncbi:MAG: Gfo/Idh/MocA family oxidoreductase [Planctomycetota bacterium]
MSKMTRIHRRGFLKQAAAAITLPTLIPSSALGLCGFTAPSNRIVMGCIGVGSQGRSNMSAFLEKDEVQIVAVCDVDERHSAMAKNMVDSRYGNSACQIYGDLRKLIERGDLDALSLALPDQWHAIPALAGARAGLDMYGEKPLSRSVVESRAMCNAVQRYGRVWQTGSWQRSVRHFRHACEVVRNGLLGRVDFVEVGLPTGNACGLQPPKPVPEGLDWDRWLGPAPWRPYCDFGKNRCHWDWRWILDFSGGQLTDWAGHHIDIAHWALDLDRTGPIEVEGKGQYPRDGLYDAPTEYLFTCKYANGLTLKVGNTKQIGFMGVKWHGADGWYHVNREGSSASNPELVKENVIEPGFTRLYESNDHIQNFLDCVKTREATITPIETACRSISVGHLGEIAMLTGRKIRWNPETEKILDDPGAEALLGRAYRKPWLL